MNMEKLALTLTVDNINSPFEGVMSGEAGKEDDQRFPYNERLGSLLHISTHNRPDITFAANISGCSVESSLQVH